MNPFTKIAAIATKTGLFFRGRYRWGRNRCPNCNHQFGKEDRTWCKMHDGADSADSILWLNYRQALAKK